MPVTDRSRFTSAFGKRDIDNGPRDHWGIDFGGPSPGESVFTKAAADGVVEWIKSIPLRSGPAIGIRHPDGTLTAYLHTRRHKVNPGQKVKRGEVIAETWHTGIPLSNGIHLHFEWWDDYRDHRSVFNPLSRLAQYGWVIKDGRLYDDWDGRATATPVTLTPAASKPSAPTTPKEEVMTPEQEAKLDRVIALIGESDRNNQGRANSIEGVIEKVPADTWKHRIGDGARAQDYLFGARMEQYSARGQARAQLAAVQAVADQPGVTVEEIREAVKDMTVSVDVNVKEK